MPISTSDVLDQNESASVLTTPMQLLGLARLVAGRIRTVRCFEDNALLKRLLSAPSQGEIVVVDGGGSLRTALLGDQIAAAAAANGWAGAIIFGAVRDGDQLANLHFQVKALGRSPRKSAKLGTGAFDIPLQHDGIVFTPGHFLYSDSDGIVILPEPLPPLQHQVRG